MESLSDAELKAILEALFIAEEVTCFIPDPTGQGIKGRIEALFEKFGAEAITRGMTDYAEYYPGSETTFHGEALEAGSEAWNAMDLFEEVRFRGRLVEELTDLARHEVLGENYSFLNMEALCTFNAFVEERIEKILAEEGIRGLVDLRRISGTG